MLIGRPRQSIRAVVHVEQDGVERRLGVAQHDGDVALVHGHAGVVEWPAGKARK